jgi:Fe-S oxidoreductase
MISKGLVEQARKAARETVDRLYPYAEQGLPIVGLEPSCLLSMRDEYHHLLPGDPKVQVVSDHCHTFEEFVSKLAEEDQLPVTFTNQQKHLLLHGHCQQRALVGTGPSKKALTLPDGYEVREIDSSCCGMAGAFGYEAEHYDISMKMGERRLFPSIRDADDDTVVVAPGTSCRHQIEDGTGKQALHPAQVLRQAIEVKNQKKP